MSKVTEETAKSTLLAIADCPYHPFLHGDNHLLYLSVGFAPYLCRLFIFYMSFFIFILWCPFFSIFLLFILNIFIFREACALEKTRFNVVPKAISETSQNVCYHFFLLISFPFSLFSSYLLFFFS